MSAPHDKRRKYEWEILDQFQNEDIQTYNNRLKRCVTYLKAELNHQEQMNLKSDAEYDLRFRKLTKKIDDQQKEFQNLQSIVGIDKYNVHSQNIMYQKELFETQCKLQNVKSAHEKLGNYIQDLLSSIVPSKFSSFNQDVDVNDYVYFECGYNNFPMGKIIEIQKNSKNQTIYEIERDDETYKVAKNQIFKTDGKRKPDIPYPLQNFDPRKLA